MKKFMLLLTALVSLSSTTAFSMSKSEAFREISKAHSGEMQWYKEITASLIDYTSEGIIMNAPSYQNFFARENEMLEQTNRELVELNAAVYSANPYMSSFADVDRFKAQLKQLQAKASAVQETVARNKTVMRTIVSADTKSSQCGSMCGPIRNGKTEMLRQYEFVERTLAHIQSRLSEGLDSLAF